MLSRIDGAIMLLLFGLFLYYVFTQIKNSNTAESEKHKQVSTLRIWLQIILGLTGLIAGGRLIVNNAVKIATLLSISEKFSSLTVVSIGTSLPIGNIGSGSHKRNSDIAVGILSAPTFSISCSSWA